MAAATGRSQVAAIGVAQEPQRVLIARQRDTHPSKPPQFSFDKKDRRVTVYYFYWWTRTSARHSSDLHLLPVAGEIWVNGHEWAKQQARKIGLQFTELSNGFASCADTGLLQGSATRRNRAPSRCSSSAGCTASAAARACRPAGRVLVGVLDGSGRGIPHDRLHPAALCPGLLRRTGDGQSRPGPADTIEIIFDRQVRAGKQRATQGTFKTKVITRGTEVTVNAFYKHSRIKQYLNYLQP